MNRLLETLKKIMKTDWVLIISGRTFRITYYDCKLGECVETTLHFANNIDDTNSIEEALMSAYDEMRKRTTLSSSFLVLLDAEGKEIEREQLSVYNREDYLRRNKKYHTFYVKGGDMVTFGSIFLKEGDANLYLREVQRSSTI